MPKSWNPEFKNQQNYRGKGYSVIAVDDVNHIPESVRAMAVLPAVFGGGTQSGKTEAAQAEDKVARLALSYSMGTAKLKDGLLQIKNAAAYCAATEIAAYNEHDAGTFGKPVPTGTDIPGARDLIRDALRRLKRLPFTGDENGVRLLEAEGCLLKALNKMTRKVTKKAVRHYVPITQDHENKLGMMVIDGKDEYMTCAEIATEIFGEPVNLGWVSSKMAETKALLGM